MRRLGFLMLLPAMLGAGALPAQRSASIQLFRTVWEDDGERTEVRINGDVELSLDGRNVARAAPGTQIVIEEQRDGGPDRRLVIRGERLAREYRIEGRPAVFDDAARRWEERILLLAARDGALDAERRIPALAERRGLDAALDEIEPVHSDGSRRVLYSALLSSRTLMPTDQVRTLSHAATRIGSDGELRALLEGAQRRLLSREVWVALLSASTQISSDGERSTLLVDAAPRAPLCYDDVRRAYLRSARGIGSDGEKARVLKAVIALPRLSPTVLVEVLRVAATIGSDGEKAQVLTSIHSDQLAASATRAAYVDVMNTIGSDGERSRVALALLRGRP